MPKPKTKVNRTLTAPVKVVRMTVRDKVGLIADSTTVLGHIIGCVSVLLGVTVGGVGVGGSMVQGAFAGIGSPENLPVSVRLVIFIMISVLLCVGLAFITNLLARKTDDGWAYLGYIAAVIWAGFLVGTADWLTNELARGVVIPEFNVFVLVGLGLGLKAMALLFLKKSTDASVSPERQVEVRSGVLSCFAISALAFYLLVTFGGAA